MPEATKTTRAVRKRRYGVVVSKSGDKTVVVEVERRQQHPLYGKTVRRKTKFHAHDEKNEARPGDKVSIVECRPVSRRKRWRVVSIDERNES